MAINFVRILRMFVSFYFPELMKFFKTFITLTNHEKRGWDPLKRFFRIFCSFHFFLLDHMIFRITTSTTTRFFNLSHAYKKNSSSASSVAINFNYSLGFFREVWGNKWGEITYHHCKKVIVCVLCVNCRSLNISL